MTFNGLQTIYSIKLMNRMLINEDYIPPMNTTLNEKFDILRNHVGVDQRYPNINLLVIGCGNNNNELNTKYKLVNSTHNPIDAALFNHVPFYLRKLDEINEHPIPEYLRLRKIIYIDGEKYLAAYGMVLTDKVYKDDVVLFQNVTDDYARIYKYDFNQKDPLNPEPNTSLDLRYAPVDFINDFIKFYVFWDNVDLDEIKHAMDVLGIDNGYKINEMGVCFSKNTNNLIEDPKEDFKMAYTESVMSQVAYFLDCNIDLNTDIMDFYIEIGGMEILGNYQ